MAVDEKEIAPAAAAQMPLIEHLRELRRRLFIAIVAIVIGAVIGFIIYDRILGFLIQPYQDVTGDPDKKLIFTDPLEAFATRLKVASYTGFILASPVVLWQLWRFITPGLHPKEKRYAIPFIAASILLFLLGGFLALATFPQALKFLVGFAGEELEPFYTASKYLGLITLMIVAFGLAFEFPVLLVFLQLAGALSSRQLRNFRRWAVIVIAIAAAVITPSQDPYSMLAIMVPMLIFYEGAIVIGRVMKK